MRVKVMVIGTEGPLQDDLRAMAEDIIHEDGLDCALHVIHDIGEILEIEGRQILLIPALVVDDKILCQGHVWS